MLNKLKSASLWTAVFTLIYLIVKNWFKYDIPAWNEISEQIIQILSILFIV